MSIPQVTDKDVEDFLATRADPLFESFFDSNFSFDFGLLPESFESSDSSTSAETYLFDGLSTGSSSTSFAVTDFSPSSAFDLVLRPAHTSHKEAPPSQPTNGAPRSRKLVHQLRPDGPDISGSELLSLEGQPQPITIVANGQGISRGNNMAAHYPLPSTPPITPNPQRVRPRNSTSPIRKHRVPTKRSKSHSAKAVAAAAAAAVPDVPYATIRMHSQTMLQTAERTSSHEIPHRPAKLPPSPPASSRFPPYDHDSTSSMSSNGNVDVGSAASVHSTPALHFDGIEPTNYAAHTANAFAFTTGNDLTMLSSPWPSIQSHSDNGLSLCPSWDSIVTTPVFDNSSSLYDLPAFSATEPHNPFLFEDSLGSSGLMIQYDVSGDNCSISQTTSGAFDTPQYVDHSHTFTGPTPSMSSTTSLNTGNHYIEHEPPPITLPKRGSTGSHSQVPRSRRTTKHTHVASRPNGPGKGSSSPTTPAAASANRGRTAQHNASHSTGSISGPNTAGSIRAHKSTGNLATAAGAKSAGSKGTGSKGTDKATDTLPPGTLGFVNFTPNDSRKILTGVAPSGSSKTKARREREAIERRRRLSEAAAKAVREAGGDLEGLRREGVFEELLK